MTVREFLNTLDHEVWAKVRPNKTEIAALFRSERKDDIFFWSADWIGGDPETIARLAPYLDWTADDVVAEVLDYPDREHPVPVIVVCAYPPEPKGE